MNCCDYKCNQGRECPARKAADTFPKVEFDRPPVTFDDMIGFFRTMLAGIGIFAAATAVALWWVLK